MFLKLKSNYTLNLQIWIPIKHMCHRTFQTSILHIFFSVWTNVSIMS